MADDRIYEYLCEVIDKATCRILSAQGQTDEAMEYAERIGFELYDEPRLGKYEKGAQLIIEVIVIGELAAVHSVTEIELDADDDFGDFDPLPDWFQDGLDQGHYWLEPDPAKHLVGLIESNQMDNWPVTVFITGSQGIGKTWFAKHLAEALGYRYDKIDAAGITVPWGVAFEQKVVKGTVTFELSEAGKILSCPEPSIALVDDGNRFRDPTFWNAWIPILDHTRTYRAENGAELVVPTNTLIFFTLNIGVEFVGTQVIDKAVRSRAAMELHMQFPPYDHVYRILKEQFPYNEKNRTGLTEPLIKEILAITYALVDWQKDGNEYSELEVSVRSPIKMAQAIAYARRYGISMVSVVRDIFLRPIQDEHQRTEIWERLQAIRREAPLLARELLDEKHK